MDRREDAGEFYPDGKVISTRPVASGGDVKHSDFAGIEPLPERFTDEDVKTRLDQLIIAAKGASAAVVALLLGAAALAAGVTVQTAPKGTIYNDGQIVTNVVFDATGLAEVTNVYTKAETEAKIVELAPAPGDYATVSNKAMTALQSYTETDPTVPGWAKSETQPLPPDYANVSNKATTALQSFTETDPTVHTWAKAPSKPTYTASEVGATTPADVTAAIREQSLGGIWDAELEVWWTPRMRNGSLTYEATTNVNLNAGN